MQGHKPAINPYEKGKDNSSGKNDRIPSLSIFVQNSGMNF